MQLRQVFAGYKREGAPLSAYAALATLFNAVLVAFLWRRSRRRDGLPERVEAADVVLLGTATYKLSRLIAKDWVTSFLRAPFAEYQGQASTSEVDEKPRGTGLQLALGELLTCPFCVGQWVAAFFAYGLVLAPRPTRFVATIFATVAVADVLGQADDGLKQLTEEG